nr:amino acid ABC transporter permease [Alexandriicola marinus]
MSDTHAQTVRYVRESMLPEQEPPLAEKGAVKWIRENLFSGWMNIILTVVSLYVIFLVLSGFLPWMFGGVWNAGSLNECREVLAANGGDAHSGACWAVVEDRWLQLLFGFYPPEFYWRPILTFLLMFVALAPVLYSDQVPRPFLAFTAIYPFLAAWLIWGGAFWTPTLVFLGFIVGYVAFRLIAPIAGQIAAVTAAIVATVVWWMVVTPNVSDGLYRMVGNSRFDSAQVEMTNQMETLPQVIAEIEEQQEAVAAEIADAVAEKDAILARIEEGSGDISALRGELDTTMQGLTALRDQASSLSQEHFRVGQVLSGARSLLGNLATLEEREASLPDARAEVDVLREALPRGLRNMTNPALAPEGTPPEVLDQIDAYGTAVNNVVTIEDGIRTTYQQLGRIGLEPVDSREIGGFMLAVIIGVAGIVLSMPLGILLALGRQSDLFIINKTCVAFIETIRGVPLIVWLFTASILLNYFLPPGSNLDLVVRVIIMVTLFAAAYIAEVIRGGLAALPKGQYEAADALGLDYWKSMRLIVLPQALKISIPGIVNTFIGLFKDTTLVVFIGLLDPVGLSNAIRASTDWNGIYWELFAFIGLLFFAFCFSMGRYSLYLEKKLQREHR